MNKVLNILSLDWDYFIDASIGERCMLFPDNGTENLSNDIQNICWTSRYINPHLIKITPDTFAISELYRLFNDPDFNPVKIHVMDSHRHCYDFVKTIYESIKCKGINLINVDFHHDCYCKDDENIHCGNWLFKLMEKYQEGKYTWIRREDSDVDNCDPSLFDTCSTDLNMIFEFNWDVVFICKSSVWSPPHLDDDFAILANVATRGRNSYIEQGILESRYTDVMKYMTIFGG